MIITKTREKQNNLTWICSFSTFPIFLPSKTLLSTTLFFYPTHFLQRSTHGPPSWLIPWLSIFASRLSLPPTLLSSSSSLTPPFQSSLSLATPLLSVQQKSLSQPPPWQGGHVLATHLSSLLPLDAVPHSQIKCPAHSRVAKEGCTIC